MHCFGLPLLQFAKRLFGSYFRPRQVWEKEMPHNLTKCIYDQLKNGIISYPVLKSHVDSAFVECRGIDQQYLQMLYYPFAQALQMVHKSFHDRDWFDTKENPQFWCKLSASEKEALQEVHSIEVVDKEISSSTIEIRPFAEHDQDSAAYPGQYVYLNG
jgi:hypothetical protein